eukprot:7539915-Ditylum_brightwellii.AAC.1
MGDTATGSADENVTVEDQTAENIWNGLSTEQQKELASDSLCYIRNYPPDMLFQVSSMNPPCLGSDPKLCNPVRLYQYHLSDGMRLDFEWGCIAGVDVVNEADLTAMLKYPHNEVLDAECYAGRFADVFEKYCSKRGRLGCDIEGIITYYLDVGKSAGLAGQYLEDSESQDERRDVWGCALFDQNKEEKEAECYAKRYPKVIPKYCKNNDPTKCDLEELKKHKERHENNVWGCSSKNGDTQTANLDEE